MKLQSHVRSIVRISVLCASLGVTPLIQGRLCRGESARHMTKRTQKVEKKLAKYRPGIYLRVVFRDHSQSVGTVVRLQATSFTFTDADSNAPRSYDYADVVKVQKEETYVGEGSVRRHLPRLLTVGMAGAVATGVIAGFMMSQ